MSKRQEVMKKLSEKEIKDFGLKSEEEIEDLHEELGIVEDEEENIEEEIVEEKPKKKAVSKKKTSTQTKKKSTKKKTSDNSDIRDILSDITIDVSNIEFSEKSPLESTSDIDFILNGKPTFQVVANQSAYIAHMESIRMADINSIVNSTMSPSASRQKLYKIVYSKINATSLGKISYKDWLRITSFYDFNTLLYGIYCQTYPTDSTFEISCGHCQGTNTVIVNNETLVDVKDEETFAKLHEIIGNVSNVDELLEKSLVNKFNRIVLPHDKILLDIQTPSLYDHLELIGSVNPEMLQENEQILTTMMFIKNLYVIDIQQLKANNKVKYVKIDDKESIFQIIKNLEVEDVKALAQAISDRSEKYAIDYKIKTHKCSNCGEQLGDIEIDMEEMLFHRLLQED